MEYKAAFDLAREYLNLLAPACTRIMTVGSVRRADPKVLEKGVHDIEFLLIQKEAIALDMLGDPLPANMQPPSLLELLLAELIEQGRLAIPQIARKANGPRFKKFAIPGHNYIDQDGKEKEFCLELWIVTESTWGIQAVIRTGPSEFSYGFVNSEKYQGYHQASGKRLWGLLPHYYEYKAGETKIVIRANGQEIETSTEESALRLLGLNESNNFWIDPTERYLYVREAK